MQVFTGRTCHIVRCHSCRCRRQRGGWIMHLCAATQECGPQQRGRAPNPGAVRPRGVENLALVHQALGARRARRLCAARRSLLQRHTRAEALESVLQGQGRSVVSGASQVTCWQALYCRILRSV